MYRFASAFLRLVIFTCFISHSYSQVIISVLNVADAGSGSLRQAINTANAIDLSDDVIIDFSALQFITAPDPPMIQLSSGEILINRPMTWLANPAPQKLTIRNVGTSRIVSVNGNVSGQVEFANIRFEGGRSFSSTSPDRGGALYYAQSSFGNPLPQVRMILQSCEFFDNLTGTDDPGNRPVGASGGAIYFAGADRGLDVLHSSLELINCLFVNNRALAASSTQGSSVDFIHASLLISRSRFIENIGIGSVTSTGGALRITNPVGRTEIIESEFRGNSAPIAGAIQYVQSSSFEDATLLLQVDSCLFVENSSNSANGVIALNVSLPDRTCRFRNCTFTRNTATIDSVITARNDALVELQHCTLTENFHRNNGGSPLGKNQSTENATFFINRTIIAGNRPSSENQISSVSPDLGTSSTTYISQGYNLIGSVLNFADVFNQAGDLTGPNNNNLLDPKLASLANYGGLTQTMPPRPESPAVDRIPGAQSGLVPLDARGVSRPGGAQGDIGAVELPRVPFVTFQEQIPDPTQRDKMLDPDGDCLTNLLEYVFGTHPTTHNVVPIEVINNEEGLFVDVIRSSLIRPAFFTSIEFQSSLNLDAWFPVTTPPVVTPLIEGSIDLLRYRYPLATQHAGREFFRMKAQ